MVAHHETALLLTCPQGHRWQQQADSSTDNTRTSLPAPSCPTCGAACSSGPGEAVSISISGTPAAPPEVPGYELLDELGRGGMAVVYKAKQLKPQRVVALKILHHPHNGDTAWISRFRSEAEAVAQLEHPHIVRMYEVGEVGRLSYLALEFVDGGNLAMRLQGQPQPARSSAELVATIARAIHFAHQRGIVHRDLKPANILLQVADGFRAEDGTIQLADVQPRITDFGLAKRLDDDGQQTRTGDILGTPTYMAPEQATGVTRNIGPAADIHALGVILYEMLTGRQPFRGADVMETMRLVASSDPVPLRRLDARIPRDLETICLKCLEKSPRQRYLSAATLADELQRYLNGETIHTRPAGPIEQTYKWTRRHPAAALALAIALLLPLLTVAGLIGHNWRISQELAKTAQQRDRAEANLQETQAAVDNLLTDLTAGRLASLPRSSPVRRQLLEWAMNLCQELRVQNPDNPSLELQSARAERQAADIQRLLGRLAEADQGYQRAIRELDRFVVAQPEDALGLRELAAAHNNSGLLREQQGRTAAAEQDYRHALDLGERAAKQFPQRTEFQQLQAATLSNRGLLLAQLGQSQQAQQDLRQAVELQRALLPQRPTDAQLRQALAVSTSNLASLELGEGRLELALQLLHDSRAELTKLRELDPENAETLATLAAVENNLATASSARNESLLATEAYNRAIAIFQVLVRDYPTVPAYREQLATTQLNLALCVGNSNETEAQSLLEQATAAFRNLASEQPETPHFRHGTTKALLQLASHQSEHGEQTAAELTLKQALQLQLALTQLFPERPDVFSQLGLIEHAAGKLLAARGADADARKYFEQAVKSQQRALAPNAEALAYRLRLRDHLQSLSRLLIEQGEPTAAALAIEQMATLFPQQADSELLAAQLFAQCLPLAAVIKGQAKIDGQTAEDFCRQRCLQLLGQALDHGQHSPQTIAKLPDFKPLRNDPQFQKLLGAEAAKTQSK
ncbi:serine/threonine-protein kinase [Anatilimnocola aggregata]|nr:serine/threonine-protein kinase [Anatilimnocola aggregata]